MATPTVTATEERGKTPTEVRNVLVSFVDRLDSGELLTGTPTVVEVGSSALTIGNKKVSTAELTINGFTVAIGKAVQCSVAGGALGSETIRITCATDADPPQTLIALITLEIIAES